MSWDVLRVLFVLLVVCYHSTFIGPLVYHDFLPRTLVFSHQVGASLLLVLSAYFAAATVRRSGRGRGGSARWWWGKLARLLPPFVVATVLAWTALRLAAPPGWYYPGGHELLTNLVMAWNWNGAWRWEYVDGSYWTLPLQVLAFSLAAVLWRTTRGRGRPLRVLLWAAVLVPLALWHHGLLAQGTVYQSVVDGLGLYRWHLFVAGVAIWMYSSGRLGHRHVTVLLSTCVVAHAVNTALVDPASGDVSVDVVAVAGIALGMLLMTVAATGPDWAIWLPPRFSRGIRWLAGISYGVFLTHQTLGYVLMIRLQQLGVGPTLQTGGMLGGAVLTGWLLTRFVEVPARRSLLRLWDRGVRRRRAPPAPGPTGPAGTGRIPARRRRWAAARTRTPTR